MSVTERMITSLWAKKEERESCFYWLPLMIHLEDTMNVSRWLWNNWLSDNQRQFCINSISLPDEETAANLAAFLGAVHDIGKATPVFQIQKGYNNSSDLDGMLLEKLEQAGFLGISSLTLADPRSTHHSVTGEYLLTKEFGVKNDIGSIVGGHHGKTVDELFEIEKQSAYPANYYQTEETGSQIYERWKNVRQELSRWALEICGFNSVQELPEISQPAQVIYSGLLIMADWISSNDAFFPLIDISTEHVPDSFVRSRDGIRLWGENQSVQVQNYPALNELFLHRFGFKPRDFQKTTYQTISQIDHPGIIILEAPMGLGKTEAALAAAEIVAAKTGSSGLFFGLPTQATSNGMFGRVHEWLAKLTQEYNIKQSLRLCHGKAALNEELNELRHTASPKYINIDEETNGCVFVNEWFSGRKKSSLDDFVVGTVDGFLLTALKQKHLALRHLGFSKKTVIIDEVHAYDTYMQQYLEEAIRWMGAYGTPVILVSATLPQEKRKSLITEYLKGMGVKGREIQFPEEIFGIGYPMISYSDGKDVKAQTDFSCIEDKTVLVKKLDQEDMLDTIAELIEDGGIVGVIVNTVRKAQKLGKECEERFGKDIISVLHSSFIATDRVNKENDLIHMIGKHGNRPERKVIIGTQVIEQSLDIDLDTLITDLCPIDLLLQRIGRLQRHDIIRPEKHKVPTVYVMGTNENLNFEKGSEWVYGNYYLIRTQYFLPDKIRIPSDIPVLINKVYGDKELTLTAGQLDIYHESCYQMNSLKESKAGKARIYRINEPLLRINPARYNMIGWLKNPDYSDSDETAAAQVRDIRETVEVIAVIRIGCGYGTFEKREDISERIGEPHIAKELAKQTIRLPSNIVVRKGIAEIIYDLEKYNLKYLREWQKQPWLKGSLGIIFDQNGCFELNGFHLKYDSKSGLQEE